MLGINLIQLEFVPRNNKVNNLVNKQANIVAIRLFSLVTTFFTFTENIKNET